MKKNSKSKVLILTPDLSVAGGVGNYYSTLEIDKIKNIRYFSVNKNKSIPFFTFFRLIKNYFFFTFLIIKDSYNIIVINPSLGRNSFYRDALFIYIANHLKKDTIVFFRGWSEEFEEKIKNNKLLSTIFKKTFAKANKYIILGKIFKVKLISLGVSPSSEFILETTVADSTKLDEFELESKFYNYGDPVRFLFLSRILEEKGIYIAIEAFSLFSKFNPSISSILIIAGDGPELNNVKNYVKSNKINHIKFPGHVKGKEKLLLLRECTILLFPSYSEGLPNSVLECMLYGMPIIGREVGGMPEIILNGENGFLTKSFDPQILADLMTKTCSNPALLNYMAKNNHEIAKERFTSEKVKKRMLNLLLQN